MWWMWRFTVLVSMNIRSAIRGLVRRSVTRATMSCSEAVPAVGGASLFAAHPLGVGVPAGPERRRFWRVSWLHIGVEVRTAREWLSG
jgi:hypothetical protein